MLFNQDQLVCQLMPQTGTNIAQVSSTTAELILTTTFYSSVLLIPTGRSRTLGELVMEKKDLSDLLQETLAVSVSINRHSLSDRNPSFESLIPYKKSPTLSFISLI